MAWEDFDLADLRSGREQGTRCARRQLDHDAAGVNVANQRVQLTAESMPPCHVNEHLPPDICPPEHFPWLGLRVGVRSYVRVAGQRDICPVSVNLPSAIKTLLFQASFPGIIIHLR